MSQKRETIEGPGEPMSGFSAQTRSWFLRELGQPTPAQAAAWPSIQSGQHTLLVAPTGSGKTLAAFLWAIDKLMSGADRGPELQDQADRSSKRQKGKIAASRKAVKVLYISPLKALGTDVAKNLQAPLEGITQVYQAQGLQVPQVSLAVRSGDTDARGRRAIAAHPPDILVTTPESLYLMLTSKVRSMLSGVQTVIVDEIHAIAGSKRGAHLALSLERLDQLLPAPAQRIGLSATVQPLQTIASFLGGRAPVTVVHPPSSKVLDLQVVEPLADMSDLSNAAAEPAPEGTQQAQSGSIWPAVEASIYQAVESHRTTLVFVNSRGLAEKLTARLNELYRSQHLLSSEGSQADDHVHYASATGSTSQRVTSGPEHIAMAHHGSVSKERRKQIEEDLKSGDLRCVVATSSLELGIDMGAIDLVIQVAPPLSVASGLQRVGRAGHRVSAQSHALLYPLNRREILQCAASTQAMLTGRIEETNIPRNPLDILAQQTVAAVSMDEWRAEDWFQLVRRAAPFLDLDRDVFESVLDMLAGTYSSDDFRLFRPLLVWDRQAGVLTSRPGAQRVAVTSGGTIADRGSYSVVLPQEDSSRSPRRVGELDEEMVYESRVGDIITLGTTSWRIQQITNDRVIVQPAPGRSARLPFWHGEALGRDAAFGRQLGALARQLQDGLKPAIAEGSSGRAHFTGEVCKRLQKVGLDANSIQNLAALCAEQLAATTVVPNDRELVLERYQDEEGDWRIILHSPYGRRVHEPWALAISARLKQQRGYDGSVYAADDGIVVRLPQEDGNLPVVDVFAFEPEELMTVVREQVTTSALFAGRFRQVAARSLFMPRAQPGHRVPLWQQRLRASQLLQAAQKEGNFPLLAETMRECLEDVYDLPALSQLMSQLEAGTVQLLSVTTTTPSPFASTLLFGYVGAYMYLYDLPQAEQSAAVLSLDSNLLSKLLGQPSTQALASPQLVRQLEDELQYLLPGRRKRGEEGVADLLRLLGPLTADELADRLQEEPSSEPDQLGEQGESVSQHSRAVAGYLAHLRGQHRARPVLRGQTELWANPADEQRLLALGGAGGTAPTGIAEDEGRQQALADLIMTYAASHGPMSESTLAQRFAVSSAQLHVCLDQLEASHRLMSGHFSDAAQTDQHVHEEPRTLQWLHPKVFARLRSRALTKARQAAKPLPPATYVQWLLRHQGVVPAERAIYRGVDGLLDLLALFEGLYLPADAWESSVLPARMPDYQPGWLDQLLASGQVVWVGRRQPDQQVGHIAFYLADSPLLSLVQQADHPAGPRVDNEENGETEERLETGLRDVLKSGAAFHTRQLLALMRTQADEFGAGSDGPSEDQLAEGIWQMVWKGELTASSFSPIRRLTAKVATGPTSLHRSPARMRSRATWGRRAYATNFGAAREPVAVAPGSAQAQAATQGLWFLLAPLQAAPAAQESADQVQTHQALEAARLSLERDGIIVPMLMSQEELPLNFAQLYPVFQSMEQAGQLLRGAFVEGLGGMQFASRATVSQLRSLAAGGQEGAQAVSVAGQAAVVVDSRDPANPYGASLPWPPVGDELALKPSRRSGSLLGLVGGQPVLYAALSGHHLVTFEGVQADQLTAACKALAAWLRARGVHPAYFKDGNSKTWRAGSPESQAMETAGFTLGPQGMKLY